VTAHRLGQGRWLGHIDVEVQLDRKASRDAVIAKAEQFLGGRPEWVRRVRVTNLAFGQWGVRFYR
jgi:hypothetical protein